MDKNIKQITVKDIDGKSVNLSDYKGKVLLIVNVASYCGYTKQYAGLEEIYKEYKDKGFEILAFPCNQFGEQEPGTNEEIKNFCSSKFDVSFKLFDKIDVNGKDKSPLYSILNR
jgi:glutathione peroxidase